jgi:hypothetical protein
MKLVRAIVVLSLVFALTGSAAAAPRTWGLGAGAFDGDFFVQARKDFWLGGDISQITGQAGLYFHGKTTCRIDLDYHFVLDLDGAGRFYPLAGIQLAFNSDSAKFGANAGGGLNFMLTEKLAAFAEAKFTFGKWDGFAIMGGVYF